eukprot:gene4045-8052_t
MEKDQEQPTDAEWGWDVPIESEDNSQNMTEMPGELRSEVDAPTATKVPSLSKLMENKHGSMGMGNVPVSNGIKSSPSFQELENAIGATLAMSMTDTDQNHAYIDYQRQQTYKYGITSPRNFPARQYRASPQQNMRISKARPKQTSDSSEMDVISVTRGELEMYTNEAESRAIIVFHSPHLSPSAIRNACQMFGVLYYLRPEFHSKGVTLLGYFDLRAAINAHAGLPEEIGGQDSSVTVHFSVMLHTSNNCDESRLVVRHLPTGRSESDVQSTFSRYGQLRSIQRTFDGEEQSLDQSDTGTGSNNPNIEFTVEYFNIQDARLSASELCVNASQLWGIDTTVAFAPLDNRKQQLCRQLLVLLTRWRSDLAMSPSTSFGDLAQQHSMALQQQQQQQQQYHMSPYGAMEMPMGMMMSGYGQMQYGHGHAGGHGLVSYVQPGMMMGRGGMPVAVSQLGHPYGMGGSPMMYPPHVSGGVAMQPTYVTHPTHGMSPASVRDGDMGGDGGLHWDGSVSLGFPDKVAQYYMPTLPHGQGRYPINVRDGYSERPPHHNGGHLGGQGRRNGRMTNNVNGGGGDADFALDLDKVATGTDQRTTLMIRNIPNKYTQLMLLNEINVRHEGTYDFYYLPIDFKNRCNVGYAFINFMEPRYIIPFFKDFNSQRWSNFNSEKVCALSYARIQGKASMVARFQNSSLLEKDNEYRPLLFYSTGPDKGKPELFPSAHRQQPQQHIRGASQQRSEWGEGGEGVSNGNGNGNGNNNNNNHEVEDISMSGLSLGGDADESAGRAHHHYPLEET